MTAQASGADGSGGGYWRADPLVVAMDGPSGTGKSTVAKSLARELGAAYLDTGAMYRAATVWVLDNNVDPRDAAAVAATVHTLDLKIGTDPEGESVAVGGRDVSGRIRGPEVTAAVSAVSAVSPLRAELVARQRELVRAAGRIVVEGRDIGTVVLPDAPVKIFLTASPRTRAQRRHAQEVRAGMPTDFDAVLADVERRDAADSSRADSPLRPAEDSLRVDTSDLDAAGVVELLISLVVERTGASR